MHMHAAALDSSVPYTRCGQSVMAWRSSINIISSSVGSVGSVGGASSGRRAMSASSLSTSHSSSARSAALHANPADSTADSPPANPATFPSARRAAVRTAGVLSSAGASMQRTRRGTKAASGSARAAAVPSLWRENASQRRAADSEGG